MSAAQAPLLAAARPVRADHLLPGDRLRRDNHTVRIERVSISIPSAPVEIEARSLGGRRVVFDAPAGELITLSS